MKNLSLFVCLVLVSNLVLGQVLHPVTWDLTTSKKVVKIGEELDLVLKAALKPNWILYANDFDPALGPAPATFTFLPSGDYTLIGEVEPINAKRKYDSLWEGEISYFEGEAIFRQRIKVLDTGLVVKGRYTYQVCNTMDGKCILGEGDLIVEEVDVHAAVPERETEDKPMPKSGQEGGKERGRAIKDSNALWEVPLPNPGNTASSGAHSSETFNNGLGWENLGPSKINIGLAPFALLAFFAGLAAFLTPCVFPMVPLTVTFFTRNSKDHKTAVKKALAYGFSIVLIYTVAGTLVASINGPAFANWLSTHWLPNLFFFAVFVLFALSFLGLFEITLPSGWVNKADSKADKAGFVGIFFMAFTLVLVSFSCTGPIVGAILVASAGGEIVKPVLGMVAFSLALALPFSILAIFPNRMDSLPKSGSWLNTVKVVLGFLELALAFKFLSVADQVYHWGILDREVFLALWIVIFSLIGVYLLGKIKLPNDDNTDRIGVFRVLLAICSLSFVVYLIPGMFGAPLKAMAGYLPPKGTQDYDLEALYTGPHKEDLYAEMETLCQEPLFGDFLHFPHGIKGYFDLEQALNCAKLQDKPVFIAFTGHGCVNCREMEAKIWGDPEVLKHLKNDFVMVALYVDEKTELPKSSWYKSSFDGRLKKTIGAQNSDFQITRFNNNAQPYHVIIDPYTRELLTAPKGYDLEKSNFVQFLEAGNKTFNLK